MSRLNLKAVEDRVKPLAGRDAYDLSFIFDLLETYGRSKSSVARLRSGNLNVADDPSTQVAQKGVVYFATTEDDPLPVIDALRTAPTVVRYSTRFVVVTDFTTLLAVDTKTGETLSTPIREIDRHFTFFLPWAGMEKAQVVAEAHADVKAAEKMARLFDELLVANSDLRSTPEQRHGLNVFFTRLLFCFFAEDTGVFTESQFTDAVASLTQPDGSDTQEFLVDLFAALDEVAPESKQYHLAAFPYVNGRLFSVDAGHAVPAFSRRARDLLIRMGRLRWDQINPDIFGSMFQAVVTPGQRSDLGQHYTSVPNILKTIEPLFLDNLKEQFSASYDSVKRLEALHSRIADIKIFDPACGSGNFLVIAYKELRRLEHAILERLGDLKGHHVLFAESRISIEHFFGIEIDDFAVEVAILSLWIAKHQMNREAGAKFDVDLPLIPLKESGRIVNGNAARTDWGRVCPNGGDDEIYLISNPPYKGSKYQTKEMKADYAFVFGSRAYSKNLDYVCLWLIKGADYIENTRAELAFIATNSISQGEHVGLLFPMIFAKSVEIGYAHTSFRWSNNARQNAGVTVIVISLRRVRTGEKRIFTEGREVKAEHINGYLADARSLFLYRRTSTISHKLPSMTYGSAPRDDGHLLMTPEERKQIVARHPEADELIKRYVGAVELIAGVERYCLWISDQMVASARRMPDISRRLDAMSVWRAKSDRASTNRLFNAPHLFEEIRYRPTESIVIPIVSSEKRDYIPLGYVGPETVVSNAANAVYGAQPWVFGLLTSTIHMSWVRAVCSRMKTDFRYSATTVYNNFPVPPLTVREIERMSLAALRILDVREYHSEKTLAQLYDPDLTPADLRLAHQQNDELIDSIYREGGFETDEDRLSHLFAMYEDMTKQEQEA